MFFFNVWCAGKWTALCEKTCDTIRVRLNIPLTKDTLKSYFENTQKSGGGYIVSLTTIKGTESKVEDALITFAESKCILIFFIFCNQCIYLIKNNANRILIKNDTFIDRLIEISKEI